MANEGAIVYATREGDKLWINGARKPNPDPQIMSLLFGSDKAWIEFNGGKWQVLMRNAEGMAVLAGKGTKDGATVTAVREGDALWLDGVQQRNPDPEMMKLLLPSDGAILACEDGQWRRLLTTVRPPY